MLNRRLEVLCSFGALCWLLFACSGSVRAAPVVVGSAHGDVSDCTPGYNPTWEVLEATNRRVVVRVTDAGNVVGVQLIKIPGWKVFRLTRSNQHVWSGDFGHTLPAKMPVRLRAERRNDAVAYTEPFAYQQVSNPVTMVCGDCVPTTCAEQFANCGHLSDGCGGELDCGCCVLPETCGGGGIDHQCGCTTNDNECGDDGCGGTYPECGAGLVCEDGECVPKPEPVEWMWGMTIDDPWNDRPAIIDAIASFRQEMTTRIVFDEWVEPAEYAVAVKEIGTVTDIQGLVVDSAYVKDYTVAQYIARTDAYVDQFFSDVQIWEIGNEVNGEWLGATKDVVAKIAGAYRVVKMRGGKTAITLYYNGPYDNGQPSDKNCWQDPNHQMMRWAEANIAPAMRAGLDYVWVSFFEDDCKNIQPDWQAVFTWVAATFPNAIIGIGECGTENEAYKATYINRYYRDLNVKQDRFAGAFFWWYGKQDFVPKTNPLWTVVQDAMNARFPTPQH